MADTDYALETTYVAIDELSTGLRDFALEVARYRPLMDQLPPALQGRIRSLSNTLPDDMEKVVALASGPYRRLLRQAIFEFVREHPGLWYLLQEQPEALEPPAARVPTSVWSPPPGRVSPRLSPRLSPHLSPYLSPPHISPSLATPAPHRPARWAIVERAAGGEYLWPAGVFEAGNDGRGNPVYVARADFMNGVHIGTAGPCVRDGNPGSQISWGGRTHALETFEVLLGDQETFEFVRYDNHKCALVTHFWKLVAGGTEHEGRQQVPVRQKTASHRHIIGKYVEGNEVAWVPAPDGEKLVGDFSVLAYKRSRPVASNPGCL